MLACVDAGNVKKAETPISPIPTAPETAANIFEKRVMCASLSTGRVPSGVIGTRSQPAEQRCALVHAAGFSAFTFRRERAPEPGKVARRGTCTYANAARGSRTPCRRRGDLLIG